MSPWYILSCSCANCGHNSSLVGPFESEALAKQVQDKYEREDEIWQGICQNIKIIEPTSPKKLLEKMVGDER